MGSGRHGRTQSARTLSARSAPGPVRTNGAGDEDIVPNARVSGAGPAGHFVSIGSQYTTMPSWPACRIFDVVVDLVADGPCTAVTTAATTMLVVTLPARAAAMVVVAPESTSPLRHPILRSSPRSAGGAPDPPELVPEPLELLRASRSRAAPTTSCFRRQEEDGGDRPDQSEGVRLHGRASVVPTPAPSTRAEARARSQAVSLDRSTPEIASLVALTNQ